MTAPPKELCFKISSLKRERVTKKLIHAIFIHHFLLLKSHASSEIKSAINIPKLGMHSLDKCRLGSLCPPVNLQVLNRVYVNQSFFRDYLFYIPYNMKRNFSRPGPF